MAPQLSRRSLCLATLPAILLAGCSAPARPARPTALRIGALFAGKRDDRGFMEAGWRGLEQARTELGVETFFIDSIPPQKPALSTALEQLVRDGAQLVIAHGGQNNEACEEVARRFPQTRFVVTQGSVTGSNLASYEILQEESAYLAGMLAALTTRTGVVGHMSGIRVRPGLKGRAAYAAGVRDTNPSVRLLTNFSGHQDDNALSYKVAKAQAAQGADVIFTMLNAGRDGVTQACREHNIRQIGNVVDWVATHPDVFAGSAMANVGMAVYQAVRDMQALGAPRPGIQKIGLSYPGAVQLSMAADIAAEVRQKIDRARLAIIAGTLNIPDQYTGPEFPNPA